MLFICKFGHHRTGRPNRARRSSPFPGLFPLLFLAGIILLLGQSRPGALFFLIPVLFFGAALAFFSFVTRVFFRATHSLEDFWSERLSRPEADEEDAFREETPRHRPREEAQPASVAGSPRLARVWARTIALQRESDLHALPKRVRRQVHALADLYEHFQALLKNKLKPDELTYMRFLNSGKQGFEMIASELEEAVDRMERLQEISLSLRPTADDTAFSGETLRQIQQEQIQKINSLVTRTRDAVAQLARVNLSISEMQGTSARKEGDLSQAIDQLKDLAQRAQRF